ncbi:MAG: AAA family ATPase [Fimbriimonadales bacterium]
MAQSADAPAASAREPLTLDTYARAKRLDADRLREWGLIEDERRIAIPYLDADGNHVATRYRHTLEGENRFTWERGNRPWLYGLWRLPEWNDSETLYLCEGETDTLTLWHADLNAVGIPGATTWREAWWEPLQRFAQICIIPDADNAGQQLLQKLANTCPLTLLERVQVLQLPEGVKDANALWLQVDADAERFRRALENGTRQPFFHFSTLNTPGKMEKTPEPIDLAERQPQPTQWLVKNLIPARHATNLYGDSGTCKSLLALHLALCVIEGIPFLGYPVHRRGKVLYLDLELDAEIHTARWWAVAHGAGYAEPPKGLRYVRLRELLGDLPTLYTLIEQEQPALVILDSFGKAVGDPLDPQRSIQVYDLIDTLPVPVLVIDHIAKPSADTPTESMREYGTVYKRHYARSALQVDLQGREVGRVAIILRQQKSNFGAVAPEIPLTIEIDSEADLLLEVRFKSGGTTVAENAELFGRRGEIVRYLREHGEASMKEIGDETGIPTTTLYRLLGVLERDNLIEAIPNTRPKQYRLRDDFSKFPPLKDGKMEKRDAPSESSATTPLSSIRKLVLQALMGLDNPTQEEITDYLRMFDVSREQVERTLAALTQEGVVSARAAAQGQTFTITGGGLYV